MTERRRFFPATPVQQVPGRTVELGTQLHPVAAAQASAASPGPGPGPEPGAGMDATWLLPVGGPSETAYDYLVEEAPGEWYFANSTEPPDASFQAWLRGQPFAVYQVYDWDLEGPVDRPVPMVGPGFVCHTYRRMAYDAPYGVYATALGTAAGAVQWQMRWDEGPVFSTFGTDASGFCRAWANGNLVTAHYRPPVPFDWDAHWAWDGALLTARAFLGDQLVRELTLGWNKGFVVPA